MLKTLWEHVRSIAAGIALYLVISTTAFASYFIPSESMVPSLFVGDHLFVLKFPYGYSQYSILGDPVPFHGRIFERPVTRGDIVVFKTPHDNKTDLIKRIVGLPGDTIEMRHGVLLINGAAVKKERIANLTYRGPDGAMHTVRRFRETLPEGRSYVTVDLQDDTLADNMGPYQVPAGHYFAMGDNRDDSLDSRWPKEVGVGFVPAENIVGKAELIAWSWSGEAELAHPSTWLQAFRSGRTLTVLR